MTQHKQMLCDLLEIVKAITGQSTKDDDALELLEKKLKAEIARQHGELNLAKLQTWLRYDESDDLK